MLPYLGIGLGLAVLVWLPASEYVDAAKRAEVSDQVSAAAEEADDALVEELLRQAYVFNAVVAGDADAAAGMDLLDYDDQLSLTGHDTAFASLVVPSISLTMPVYHGTDDAALSAGAGHLEGSSLPVGGASTHAVISAHSGLTGSQGFDRIVELEEGDLIYVKVLGQTLAYEVTGSEVVEPDETESLAVAAGEDLLTLVTCWPYGVNTHRLLVHAQRTELPEDADDSSSSALSAAASSGRLSPLLAVLAVLAAAGLFSAIRRRAAADRRIKT